MRLLDLDTTALADHGLVTRSTSGLTRSAWYRALRSGAFEQLHPGVARLAGSPTTYRQRIAAAVLAANRPRHRTAAPSEGSTPPPPPLVALASHRSAASLWDGSAGVEESQPTALRPVDLVLLDRRRSASLSAVIVHRPIDQRRLTPARIDGIRCTNILRTLLDLGAVDPGGVHPLLGHALSAGLVNLDAVETALLEHGRRGRSGIHSLRTALDDWAIDAKPADSVLEIAFARLVARHGLPPVEFHPRIEGWEIDFRFVGTRVLVECDGWTTHGLDRRQFERDRRRDDDLGAAGWVVSRHTYRAITNDHADTAARLRRLLASTGS